MYALSGDILMTAINVLSRSSMRLVELLGLASNGKMLRKVCAKVVSLNHTPMAKTNNLQ